MRILFYFIVSFAVLRSSAQRVNRGRCRASSTLVNLAGTSAALPSSTPTSVASGSGSKPDNLATSTSGCLSALIYRNVGASGSYNMVTAMHPGTFPTCDVNPKCEFAPRSVSGKLAPFNEDMTMVFRGPMKLDNVNVYQPGEDGSWGLVSKFTAGKSLQNMVFMNNMGGDKSGEFSICQGMSQSYASGDLTGAVSSPNMQVLSGNIPAGKEANIMTSEQCSSGSCPGFYRGTANVGWRDSKLFVVQFEMPPSGPDQPPAIWVLNGQIVRTAQYGCNCRGMGARGGCGELDVIEVLPEKPTVNAYSEIYSFKGTTGSGDDGHFARPTSGSNIYAVFFDTATDQIAIQHWFSFDFSTGSIPRSLVDGYLSAPAKVVSFGANARRAHKRRSVLHHGHEGF